MGWCVKVKGEEKESGTLIEVYRFKYKFVSVRIQMRLNKKHDEDMIHTGKYLYFV